MAAWICKLSAVTCSCCIIYSNNCSQSFLNMKDTDILFSASLNTAIRLSLIHREVFKKTVIFPRPRIKFWSIPISEAKHCPVTSDCRALITKPLPPCQSEVIMKLFDENYKSDNVKPCFCCYSCIESHSHEGCLDCQVFLAEYFPGTGRHGVNKSVSRELNNALQDLFNVLKLGSILIESEFEVPSRSFIKGILSSS